MTEETGELQFTVSRTEATPVPGEPVDKLLESRQKCYTHGFIGCYENGIGFGNISLRPPGETSFFITGTQTGTQQELTRKEIVQITGWSFEKNHVDCRGLLPPSSETLTHAAIYEMIPDTGGVIHAHHEAIWTRLHQQNRATRGNASAGTVEICREVMDWIREAQTGDSGLFALSGHREGILAYGPTLEIAGTLLFQFDPQTQNG